MADGPELLIPMGRKLPLSIAGTVHQCGHSKVGDIGRAFGRGARLEKPIYLYREDGSVIIIAGLGKAEAAELEDLAQSQLERKPFDFAAARERAGLPPKEKFDGLFRDALERKNEQYKRNIRTDAGHQKRPKRVWTGGIDGVD
jgi:hypothetical protein